MSQVDDYISLKHLNQTIELRFKRYVQALENFFSFQTMLKVQEIYITKINLTMCHIIIAKLHVCINFVDNLIFFILVPKIAGFD